MTLTNPADPPEVQVAKQAKIIEALMRQANRQGEVGPSAFRAFQSAIELQQKVAAQSRDLARAETELESVRYERSRMRRKLVEALSSMDEGFALFTNGALDLCNEPFSNLLPDISSEVQPGLSLREFFALLASSEHLLSNDGKLDGIAQDLLKSPESRKVNSLVIELTEDRSYQISVQQTSPENLFVLMTDITQIARRNRVEKETLIDRQADYLQAVFQNMSSGICTFSAEGNVTMHNARFCEIAGVPARVLSPGAHLRGIIDFMAEESLLQPDLIEKIDNWRDELARSGWVHARVATGPERVIDVKVNMLPDRGYLLEMVDVTAEARSTEILENRVMARTAELTRANAQLVEEYEKIARVEEELRKAKERAEAAVSSKTRFLAAASHDLLQPINAAKLMISTLEELTRDSQLAGIIERLHGAFNSAEQLLHSLLDISRLESADPDIVNPSKISLNNLMEGVYADQVLMAEQKNIRLDMVPCSGFVLSDPIYLLRSLQNLVVNAIQYTEPGGRVLVGCRRKGENILMQVLDTGIGIKQEYQAHIFEEFNRAGAVQDGTGMGLGLSVVDRTCRLLGHKLTLQSRSGQGSVFSIEMPMVEGSETVLDLSELIPASDGRMLDYIVLVVENNEDVLHGTTLWLEQWGASVLAARNSQEAMNFISEIGMPPDIILADYDLDDGDNGLDVISRIRRQTQTHIPAMLITADRRDELRQTSLMQDVSVMTKPVKAARLRAQIHWRVHTSCAENDALVGVTAPIPTKVAHDSTP